uniref:BEC n=1 Tax=Cupriavidus necator TaxID=106590 RepID=Q9AHJ3_CUPNE|nr:BEC [Cupriavidus necator]
MPSGQLDFIPAIGTADFTPQQARLLAPGQPPRPRALRRARSTWDREASFPFANYADLREAGLLALCVSQAFGGEGADFATYCMVGAEIGRFCGATALTYNMHICSTMWTGVLSDGIDMTPEQRAEHEARRELHFSRVVRDGAVYAQRSPKLRAAAGKAPFGTTARKVEGGWVLNGRKIFASLSGAADYYGILCTEDRGDQHPDMRDTLYIAVPGKAEGLTVTGEWDPMGMRGTVSGTLLLKDVFVPDHEQLMPRGVYYRAAQTWPAMFFTLSPTYLGVAPAAYDFTVQYLRGEVPGQPPVKRRMYPTKQIAVAQMRIQLETMRSIIWRVIHEARPNPTKNERLRLYAAHYTVMEGAKRHRPAGDPHCGGQSMLKDLRLSGSTATRAAVRLMLPWTAELILDRMGRETLYESGERDE